MSAQQRPINAQILCYLSPAARAHLDELVASGYDIDLAFSILEGIIPDSQLFDLTDSEVENGKAS